MAKKGDPLIALVAQPAYSGLCLLDFEELRADWNSTSPALQDASLKFAKGDAMLAKTSYEAAAKKFFLATIRTVRELRPGCKLGWYGYPRNPLPHLLTPGWTAYCKSHAGVCWPFVAPGGGSGIGYDGDRTYLPISSSFWVVPSRSPPPPPPLLLLLPACLRACLSSRPPKSL